MDDLRLRRRLFLGLVATVLVILLGRLVQLQLLESDIHTDESMRTAVHSKRVNPSRGLILDRERRLLVDNAPGYSLTVIPRYFDASKIGLLADLLGVAEETVTQRVDSARAWSSYRASRIFRDVPFEVFSRIQENLYQLPGVDFSVDARRRYHGEVNGSHIYGYLTEVTRQQLDRKAAEGYFMGDRIGQAGIEGTYESHLRGQMGAELVLVNIRGQEVKAYRNGSDNIDPVSGHDLVLTIDAHLQALAEDLLVNKRGAVVALDPRNGEILALASAPDFDPAYLSGMVDDEIWQGIQKDKYVPLFNRATLSRQPPGSTFKPFMALTALQDGVIAEDTPITCTGGYYFGGRYFRCMDAHGTLTVKDAIKRSCNTFFFTVMMRQDFQRWSEWGERFGFGVKMPTDLPVQIPGIFPDSTYFDRRYGKNRWTRGFLVSLGIGQGDLGVTPLQLARYCAAVANGGVLHSPHLVKKIIHSESGEEIDPEVAPADRIPIEPRYFDMVREGMRRMVMENNSTVKWGDMQLGGKTGTAQNPHGADHAWFMGFAPFEEPQIAVAILVENAGFGSSVSAPIGGLLMEQYLTGDTSQHPAWVHAMARNKVSEGMEDGSGAVWHRAPGERAPLLDLRYSRSRSSIAGVSGG